MYGCTNGSDVCESAQTCLWFSVGCSIGCKECDGGDKGPANPNITDRCGSGMNATVNYPLQRTINRHAVAGSDEDWTKFNSWKCTCLRSVRPVEAHATGGHGEFTNTKYAKLGDLGSNLPKMPSGAIWKARLWKQGGAFAPTTGVVTNIDSARRTPI